MRFQRFLARVFALSLTIPLILSFIHAHPGHTDSNGGHTDHDTGEYHYHHGYPSHEHYDMDDNGIIDCPYDFDDKTGQNSGTSSASTGNSDVTHKTFSRLDWILNGASSNLHSGSEVTQETCSRVELMQGETHDSNEDTHTNTSSEHTLEDSINVIAYALSSFLCIPLTIVTMYNHKIGYKTGKICGLILIPFIALQSILTSWLIIWITYKLTNRYFVWNDRRIARKAEERRKKALLEDARRKLSSPPPSQAKPKEASSAPVPIPLPNTPKSGTQQEQRILDKISTPSEKPLTSEHLHPYLQDGVCSYVAMNADKPIFPPISPKPEPPPRPIPPQPGPDIPVNGFIRPDPRVDFRPHPGLNTEVSVHARCRDTCRYLWYETLLIRTRTSPPISSNSCIYIWTALFYTVVKTLRSQDSVNRIYSYFDEVTGNFVTEIQYRQLVTDKVREVYRSIRETLNKSGIDPRTENGRQELWFLIAQLIPEGDDPRLQEEFEAATERMWKTIANVFPQAKPHPKTETRKIKYSIREDELPFDL